MYLRKCIAIGFSNSLAGVLLLVTLCTAPAFAKGYKYECQVTNRYSFGNAFSKEEIEKGRFSIVVEDYGTDWYISRCAFSSEQNQDVCIRYRMDAYEYDRRRHIRRYFIKNPQYQLQMFNSLSFVEDDSIGITQYGKCVLIGQD